MPHKIWSNIREALDSSELIADELAEKFKRFGGMHIDDLIHLQVARQLLNELRVVVNKGMEETHVPPDVERLLKH